MSRLDVKRGILGKSPARKVFRRGQHSPLLHHSGGRVALWNQWSTEGKQIGGGDDGFSILLKVDLFVKVEQQ